jgi:SAM-dependent methyltransferase
MPRPDWNDRYALGDTPWDIGEPDPHLVEFVGSGVIVPGRVLEVGCGTGTDALWLAGQGYAVLGVDISPLAVERARAKQAATGVECRFELLNFMDQEVAGGPFDLVFDRGAFHVFDEPEERAGFAARVARVLAADGKWVSLIGSTEGPPREHGPPRRSARDVVEAIEPVLEIVLLRATEFRANIPSPAKAWLSLARARDVFA